MWSIDPVLLACAVTAIPLMALAIWGMSRPMVQRTLEHQDADGQLYAQVERALTAAPVVQAFRQERRTVQAFRHGTAQALAAALRATSAQLRFTIAVGLAAAVPTALVLGVGARHVLAGTLTLGELLVFLAYLETFYAPVRTVVYSPESLQGASGSAARVLEVLEAQPEVVDRPRARHLGPLRGHLVLDDVVFGYEPDRPVLDHVSVEVRPGQTVAVVGPSGAGKSTLLSLVPRFHDPWSGRVLLDGHDVRDVRLDDLRKQVSVVLQEPFLFPLSIADNIAYAHPDASREQIEQAARDANADTFVRALPDGYDTILGERGATLSGGQRQRLSIARALLKDAPILLLDEPTSALDNDSERLLLNALERLMAGRTTLIIAHRLSTIRNADHIVVLDAGHVVETGTHAELLRDGKHYAHLHTSSRRSARRTTAAR
jgi:ATP-binding cassette subfamily B protein/subfamily B ATP-binding cassette protein MsbA